MPQQQPQLTPQRQILADLQQQEPDKYAAVKYNGQLSNFADIELRRRQQQAEIDDLNAKAAPNSPFLNDLLQKAKQMTIRSARGP